MFQDRTRGTPGRTGGTRRTPGRTGGTNYKKKEC